VIKKVIKKKKGFTLIELLVVIAIIIILAAILLPYIINRVEDSRISRMTGEIRTLKTAALLYYNDLGIFPVRWDALNRPVTTDNRWRGPYIEKIATPLTNTITTNDTWQNASPWRTDFVLVTQYVSAGFKFANQTGDEYTFVKAVALVVANPTVAGANAIPASSLRKIDTELDNGIDDTGFIVCGNGVPNALNVAPAANYAANNASLVVLLQGLK
jgi:prepilin-type N-terminal cleavage/methylation domain-containing protein